MALRPDRVVEMTDCLHTLSTVASKGVGLVVLTAGSGVAMGDSHGAYDLVASPSGSKFAGILLQDFVNVDETRYHINWNKEEQNIGDYADVMTKGWVITDKVTGTPTDGDKAYLTTNGVFTPTISSTGGLVATPFAGKFGGTKDELGFAKVWINVPNSL